MREAMRMVLEHEGFAIHETGDGRTALQLVRDQQPDLVFLDLNIPGVAGVEVLRAIKQDASTAMVRVIIVTATGEEGRAEVVALGADDYFTKPFSPRALLPPSSGCSRRARRGRGRLCLRLPLDRLARAEFPPRDDDEGPMFDTLTGRLDAVFKKLRSRGKLHPKQVDNALGDMRSPCSRPMWRSRSSTTCSNASGSAPCPTR